MSVIFFSANLPVSQDCSLDKQIIYDKLTLQFHRSDERGAVVKSSVVSRERGCRRSIFLPIKREEDAGLRENMSQTVTKVERCHRSGAGEKLSHRIIACMTARFPFYRKARFILFRERAKPEI
jgi:hypothetical protein